MIPTLYHGTDVDFKPGALVLPGILIGRQNHPLSKKDKVYLSTNPNIARIFANDFKRPGKVAKVYEVEPVDPAKVEPRIEDSHEWVARMAKIVRRVS